MRLTQVLYLLIFNGSWLYRSQYEPVNLFWTGLSTTCNTRYLHSAVATPWYAIKYTVKPAMYLSDTSSVFYNGQGSGSSLNATIAQLMQWQIVQFVKTGNPNAKETRSMNRAQDGLARVRETTKQPSDQHTRLAIETRGRFIQEENLWFRCHLHADTDFLPLFKIEPRPRDTNQGICNMFHTQPLNHLLDVGILLCHRNGLWTSKPRRSL